MKRQKWGVSRPTPHCFYRIVLLETAARSAIRCSTRSATIVVATLELTTGLAIVAVLAVVLAALELTTLLDATGAAAVWNGLRAMVAEVLVATRLDWRRTSVEMICIATARLDVDIHHLPWLAIECRCRVSVVGHSTTHRHHRQRKGQNHHLLHNTTIIKGLNLCITHFVCSETNVSL